MKRKTLNKTPDYQHLAIGIASDKPIWKLCWQVNKSLGWSLVRVPVTFEAKGKHGPETPLLFDSSDLTEQPLILYEDATSLPQTDLMLYEIPSQIAPQEVRSFRYILLLRVSNPKNPKLEEICEKLNNISFVISAVDLTHVKNIKQIFL